MRLKLRRPPRLATLLLLSNMAVLALPISGLWALRLYESALVRQTESELIAQAAVVAGAFREELRRDTPNAAPSIPGAPFPPSPATLSLAQRPGLDLADDPVLPPPPDPVPAGPADPQALAIGQVLAPVLRDAQAVTLAALRVTDAHGIVVASTGGDLGLSLAGWQEVAKVLAGAPIATSMRHHEMGKPSAPPEPPKNALRVFVALPVQGVHGIAGVVVLSRTPRDLFQAVWGKRWALGGLAVVLLAIGVVLALGMSRLVTRPIARVVRQAQFLARGGEIGLPPRPGTQEVAELSMALTRMATTLDQRARYITAFAVSVSHEFKTPLATLRGASELLDDDTGDLPPHERARLLALLSESTARLDRLVSRLLDLARADMMRPASCATPLAPVLRHLVSHYAGLGLSIDAQAGDATVALPASAVEAMLSSLLDNAASHAGASAHVRIKSVRSVGQTRIEVQDDGPGISAANRDRVFDLFFTTSRSQGGTGLGLPIAQAIARGAGGDLQLMPSERGALFVACLPTCLEEKEDFSFTEKSGKQTFTFWCATPKG